MSALLHRVSQGPRSSCPVVPLFPRTLEFSAESSVFGSQIVKRDKHTWKITLSLLLARSGYGTHHFHSYSKGQTFTQTFTPIPRLKRKQENESNYKPKRGKKWVFMNTYSPPRFCLLWFRPSYSFPRSWKNHFKIARTSLSKLLTFKVTCLYQDLSVLFLPLSPAKF